MQYFKFQNSLSRKSRLNNAEESENLKTEQWKNFQTETK